MSTNPTLQLIMDKIEALVAERDDLLKRAHDIDAQIASVAERLGLSHAEHTEFAVHHRGEQVVIGERGVVHGVPCVPDMRGGGEYLFEQLALRVRRLVLLGLSSPA